MANNSIQNALSGTTSPPPIFNVSPISSPVHTVIVNNVGPAGNQVDTIQVSTGEPDAHKVPELNSVGELDMSFLNTTSVSEGAASAGEIPLLNSKGVLDVSALPPNIGTLSSNIIASELIYAGALVNIWDNAGIPNVRLANASVIGKEADGYVLSGVPLGAAANVFFEGINTSVISLTSGLQYLSNMVAGGMTQIPPSIEGETIQTVGVSVSPTALVFQRGVSILL